MRSALIPLLVTALLLGLGFGLARAAPPMVESGGVLSFPGVNVTSSALPLNGLFLPASNAPGISVNATETVRFPAARGAANTVYTSGGIGAQDTWGTAPVTSASASFSGDVSITAYPLNTDWSAFIPFVNGTTRKLCFTTEVIGTGTNGNTVLATIYNRTGAANVCTLAVGCNSTDAPVGTVACADCAGSLTSTSTYGMRWTTDACTLRPSGDLNLTYTTP